MNKVVDSAQEAVSDIRDGASILVGGFGVIQGWPSDLLKALRDRDVRDLTLICNTPGMGPRSPQILAEKGQVRRLMASFGGYPYMSTATEEQIGNGEIEFELIPQGTLVERARAGGAGIAAFFTPTGVGTEVEKGKEMREIDGRKYLVEQAIRSDVTFVKAAAGDSDGNLVFRGGGRNFNPAFASAGKLTIAEVEEIVSPGDLNPEEVVTPGIFVDRVVLTRDKLEGKELERVLRGIRGEKESGLPGIGAVQMAQRTAAFFEAGDYVNLGIGLPTQCSNFLKDRGVTVHAENGLLGYGGFPEPGSEDIDVYNAGGQLVTLLDGASCSDSTVAFAMARGGHVDRIVLGGFQVASNGDLANWKAPHMKAGGVGGAMDLAAGGGELTALMYHTTKKGESKIVERCSYPLTAPGCVSRVVTNLAVLAIEPGTGFVLKERAPGVSVDEIRAATAAPLTVGSDVPEMQLP